MQKIGIDLNRMLVTKPSWGDDAMDQMAAVINSDSVDLIVCDSVAALTPRDEAEKEFGSPTSQPPPLFPLLFLIR